MVSRVQTGQCPETHHGCGIVPGGSYGGAAEAGDSVGEILFVPTRRRGSAEDVLLEMRTLSDGRLALPAYTSLPELIRCCGPRQAWMGVDSAGLREIHRTTGYDLVLLDGKQPPPPPPPSEDEYTQPRSWLRDPLGRGTA